MSQKYEAFGKFILLDKVAAGGMAEVYRAKAPGAEGIGKVLAIKRILPQYTSNPEFVEMFKSEAKIAVNLTQANIAQIFEFGEEQNQFYLVMEYIDGRNLRQVLSRCAKLQRALTIEQCVFIIAQVANGLDYAHRCLDKNTGNPLNIIHRDMSPQNVMLSFEGEVKIVDFGIAKAETKIENTRAGTLKGKFGYMSPEQAEGLDLDARTDIFSTGIVLWELLSGERLFVANNEVNTIRKIKECQIPSLRKINPNIHEELERIALKALAKDRSLRYQTAAELYRDLSRFLYKVNPEFTQHDLAVTIKSLFKEDILDDRKKIVEFAKVQFPATPPRDDKTAAADNTRTLTSTNEMTQSTLPHGKIDVPKNLIPEENLHDVKFDIKVESAELLRDVLRGQQRSESYTGSNLGTVPPSPIRQNTSSFRTRTGFTQTYAKQATSMLSRFVSMVVIITALAAGLLIIGKPYARKIVSTFGLGSFVDGVQHALENPRNKKTVAFGKQSGGQIDRGTIDQSSSVPQPQTGNVILWTNPAGASVEIDGKPLNSITPLEANNVPLQRPVLIVIRREGYMPFSKSYVFTDNVSDLRLTLSRANAFLNIDVVGGGVADIYLDDQKISSGVAVRHYPVQGNKKYIVKAYNQPLNLYDSQEVLVKPDSERYLKMFLRKSK